MEIPTSLTPSMLASIEYQMQRLHENHDAAFIAITVIFLTLATAAVVLRFLSRRIAHAPYKWDDWTALLSLALLMVLNGLSIHMTFSYGFGRHVVAVGPRINDLLKFLVIFELVYGPTLMVIKLSFVLLYLRIFGTSPYRRVFIWIGVYMVLQSVAFEISMGLQCRPLRKTWDPTVPGKCASLKDMALAFAATNILGDLLLLVGPIPIVWRLQASQSRRLAVIGIFMLGGLVCIVSVIRMIYVPKIFTFDTTWNGWAGGQLSSIEPHVGLVCVCLPTMMPLFRRKPATGKSDLSGESGHSGWSWSQKFSRLRSRPATSHSVDSSSPSTSQRYPAPPLVPHDQDTRTPWHTTTCESGPPAPVPAQLGSPREPLPAGRPFVERKL